MEGDLAKMVPTSESVKDLEAKLQLSMLKTKQRLDRIRQMKNAAVEDEDSESDYSDFGEDTDRQFNTPVATNVYNNIPLAFEGYPGLVQQNMLSPFPVANPAPVGYQMGYQMFKPPNNTFLNKLSPPNNTFVDKLSPIMQTPNKPVPPLQAAIHMKPMAIKPAPIKQEPKTKSVRRKRHQEEHDEALLSKIPKKKHSKELRFECTHEGCNRRFAWKWTMETHAKTHLGEAGRVHKCPKCNKGFFTVGCMRSHMSIHTRKPGSFACKHAGCKKSYSTSEGLSLHVRNHHEVEKKFTCPDEHCTKRFVRQADLKLHVIRVHCKERPFPCASPNCGKAFACLSELKRHLKFHKNCTIAQQALEEANRKTRNNKR